MFLESIMNPEGAVFTGPTNDGSHPTLTFEIPDKIESVWYRAFLNFLGCSTLYSIMQVPKESPQYGGKSTTSTILGRVTPDGRQYKPSFIWFAKPHEERLPPPPPVVQPKAPEQAEGAKKFSGYALGDGTVYSNFFYEWLKQQKESYSNPLTRKFQRIH